MITAFAAVGVTIGAGTLLTFIVDNSAGANTVTVAVDAGTTLAVTTPAITGGATLTVSTANVIGIFGIYITSATAANVTLTMPTALALAQALNARPGTSVCFILYNSGANTLTLAVNTGITTLTTPLFTGGNTLTLSAANAIANYELVFTSVTNGGTGAAVTPTISGGAVTGFGSVTPGSGYTKPPIVQISGGGGKGATAVCTLSAGGVATVTLLTGGSGYTSVPVVTFLTDDAITAATAKIIRTT